MVFHVSRSYFYGFSWFLVGFHGSWSWVVTGLCHSSPQQSWVGDPGWAPLSRRRSQAPRLFLRLPICTISCGHVALFCSILCHIFIFRFSFIIYTLFWGLGWWRLAAGLGTDGGNL